MAPTAAEWMNVKKQVKLKIEESGIMQYASALQKKAIALVLDSIDPKDIFALSDIKNLGEALLSGTSWTGTLDLSDAESVTRFLTYVK